ncbi:MAG: hypothetical protein JXR37_19280 [Kiritimatiellae bacterium]|nr:hypothetical protein [Kiritimatiellia bacterium]
MKRFGRWLIVVLAVASTAGTRAELPDSSNPDYVLCADFEDGKGPLSTFSIYARHGVRAGAGFESDFGYSNVMIENNGLPPTFTVAFPAQTNAFYIHYHVKTPANFYHGLGGHGFYIYDADDAAAGKSVIDPLWSAPAWLDPDWDPFATFRLRGSGYHRITESFEGCEPGRRGQWHSYQVLIIPSENDPAVGRMKVWVDGELAAFCRHDTVPRYNRFWFGHYWHSHEYVPKDTLSNLFEMHTAPPHPAFEVFIDNLIVSRKFVEFGPNRFRIERVRFGAFRPGGFTVYFDTSATAATVRADWGPTSAYGRSGSAAAGAHGLFHAIDVDSVAADTPYRLRLRAQDAQGRTVYSEEYAFVWPAGRGYPDFDMPDWKGEVYANTSLSGTPVMIRNFRSLSHVSWPGPASDDVVDTGAHLSVRYTRNAHWAAGDYVLRTMAYDGIKVRVDDAVLLDDVRRTNGHNPRRDLALTLAAGEHRFTVEHTMWRYDDWERTYCKYLCFKIESADTRPPELYAQAIYNSRYYEPDRPVYIGRWSERCSVTVDYGVTTAYGSQLTAEGRNPKVKFPSLETGRTYHYRARAVDMMGNATVTPDAVFTVGDTIPPPKTMIRAVRASTTKVRLEFRAPGEDARHGTAAGYDIRYATAPMTLSTWHDARPISVTPVVHAGNTWEEITLDGFPAGPTYYFAMQGVDAAGQRGLLSNVASLPAGPETMDLDGDGFGVGCALPDADDYDPAVGAPGTETEAPGSPRGFYVETR